MQTQIVISGYSQDGECHLSGRQGTEVIQVTSEAHGVRNAWIGFAEFKKWVRFIDRQQRSPSGSTPPVRIGAQVEKA